LLVTGGVKALSMLNEDTFLRSLINYRFSREIIDICVNNN